MRTDSLFFILFLVLMLGVFQNLAFEHFLYWKFWWYDVMMHFLGGAIVGSIFSWFVAYEFSGKLKDWLFRFGSVFLFVLIVGVFWEIFEYFIGVDQEFATMRQWLYDSGQDLVMDLLGGCLAYFVFSKTHQKYE